jgi:hypothetical protein
MRGRFFSYSLTAAAAVAALWLLPVGAAAQQTASAAGLPSAAASAASAPTPRTADGHPDLNGIWDASGRRGPIDSAPKPINANGDLGYYYGNPTPENLRAGTVLSAAPGAAKREADPNKPPYKTEALAKAKELDENETQEDPGFHCMPPGVPRMGAPAQIVETPGQLVFLYVGGDAAAVTVGGNTFRIIPIDGRPHRKNLDQMYNGDSVGHWEGDTLVVDVIGFTDETWLGVNGWFHTTAMHVTERLTREGNTLHYQATVEDPNVFTRPWQMNPITKVLGAPGEQLWEDPPCVEGDSGHLVTKEHH